MLSSFLRKVQSSIREIEHISIRAASAGSGCEVRVQSEESGRAICQKVRTIGMTGRITAHYPSLGFWLVSITIENGADQDIPREQTNRHDDS